MEKRFITPFGTIDIIFRNVLDMKKKKPHMEIEVGGDAEYWISYNSAGAEFKAALLHFVWGMITNDHLEKNPRVNSCEVRLYIKGSENDPTGHVEILF